MKLRIYCFGYINLHKNILNGLKTTKLQVQIVNIPCTSRRRLKNAPLAHNPWSDLFTLFLHDQGKRHLFKVHPYLNQRYHIDVHIQQIRQLTRINIFQDEKRSEDAVFNAVHRITMQKRLQRLENKVVSNTL